jgi:hypothetical protein
MLWETAGVSKVPGISFDSTGQPGPRRSLGGRPPFVRSSEAAAWHSADYGRASSATFRFPLASYQITVILVAQY